MVLYNDFAEWCDWDPVVFMIMNNRGGGAVV